MPDEIPMVTTCPLCLAPDEVESMVTVQIERAIPKGRAAVMICRNCIGAVREAAEKAEPPLFNIAKWMAGVAPVAQPASESSAPGDEPDVAPEGVDLLEGIGFHEIFACPPDCDLEKAGVPHFHSKRLGKESTDG